MPKEKRRSGKSKVKGVKTKGKKGGGKGDKKGGKSAGKGKEKAEGKGKGKGNKAGKGDGKGSKDAEGGGEKVKKKVKWTGPDVTKMSRGERKSYLKDGTIPSSMKAEADKDAAKWKKEKWVKPKEPLPYEVPPVEGVRCKNGHWMVWRSDNPKGYTNPACCDKCERPNLVQKHGHFFHCGFCRWDVCKTCAVKLLQQKSAKYNELRGSKLRAEKEKEDEAARIAAKEARLERRRTENLPDERTCVNRAPETSTVVSTWQEGMPV